MELIKPTVPGTLLLSETQTNQTRTLGEITARINELWVNDPYTTHKITQSTTHIVTEYQEPNGVLVDYHRVADVYSSNIDGDITMEQVLVHAVQYQYHKVDKRLERREVRNPLSPSSSVAVYHHDRRPSLSRTELLPSVIDAINKALPRVASTAKVYPLLSAPGKPGYTIDTLIPTIDETHIPLLDAFVRTETVTQLSEKLFNSTRKDIVRTLARTTNISLLHLATVLYDAETMPVDWVVEFLNHDRDNKISRSGLSCAKYLVYLDRNSRKRLLRQSISTDDAISINDMANFANIDYRREHAITSTSSWHTLEQTLLSYSRKQNDAQMVQRVQTLRADALLRKDWINTPAGIAWKNAKDEAERLAIEAQRLADERRMADLRDRHAERVERYENVSRIVREYKDVTRNEKAITPTDAKDLDTWSETMHNCIHSYKSNYNECVSVLFAIIRNGEMVANGEIDANRSEPRVVQLQAKHNHPFDNDSGVRSYLRDHGIS